MLRQGRVSGTGPAAELSPTDLTRMMVGTTTLPKQAERIQRSDRPVRLMLSELSADDDKGHRALAGVSLEVCGRRDRRDRRCVRQRSTRNDRSLARSARTLRGGSRGSWTPYHASRSEMRRHKIYCLPEEPLRNACVARMTISENLAFRSFERVAVLRRWFADQPCGHQSGSRWVDRPVQNQDAVA